MSCLALDARLSSEYGKDHLIYDKLWVCFPTSDFYPHPPHWRVTKELHGYKGKRHTPHLSLALGCGWASGKRSWKCPVVPLWFPWPGPSAEVACIRSPAFSLALVHQALLSVSGNRNQAGIARQVIVPRAGVSDCPTRSRHQSSHVGIRDGVAHAAAQAGSPRICSSLPSCPGEHVPFLLLCEKEGAQSITIAFPSAILNQGFLRRVFLESTIRKHFAHDLVFLEYSLGL